MVTEALAVNGPAGGKCLNLLTGQHLYIWQRDGQPEIEYKVCRWGVDNTIHKRSKVAIYRIAFVDPKPSDEEIEAVIKAAYFDPYFYWNPWKNDR